MFAEFRRRENEETLAAGACRVAFHRHPQQKSTIAWWMTQGRSLIY